MNQIGVASVMMHLNITKSHTVEEDMVRHMILNSLRMYRERFFDEFGELVICYDSKHYWRREYYPEYKASRKKTRETSGHDWNNIFGCLNSIKEELTESFPYKVIEVYGAEADDIIASLCMEHASSCPNILILSGDKDFVQLHKYKEVKQYSPVTKKFINGPDPIEYLYEHILKGDVSDGVPNVLSPDNTFVDGLRQRPLSKKKISSWAGPMCEQLLPNEEVKRNYQRNKKLIDLTECPRNLYDECVQAYSETPEGDRSKLLNYFIDKKLSILMDNIGDF